MTTQSGSPTTPTTAFRVRSGPLIARGASMSPAESAPAPRTRTRTGGPRGLPRGSDHRAVMSTSGPYLGHGQKQRDLVRMSPAEVDDFLHDGRTLTMCTLLPDGSVHAIGMWYG